MTHFLIVDDHPIFREGLAMLISARPGWEVCGEADNVKQALAHLKTVETDLAIVDIVLREDHGLDLIAKIKKGFPRVKMLVVSAYEDGLYAERALRAGAQGYMNKRDCQHNIIDALRTVLDGEVYASAEVQQSLLNLALGNTKGKRGKDAVATLTNREIVVFQSIGEGLSSSEIARNLNISTHTVDTHRENIKAKLRLDNAAKLQRAAVQWVLEN